MRRGGSAGRGRGRQSCREPSCAPMWSRPTPRSAKDSSVTAHCHAATALLTREYQGDHRRHSLTPASTCAACTHEQPCPLDKPFHIRSAQRACACTQLRLAAGGRRFTPWSEAERGLPRPGAPTALPRPVALEQGAVNNVLDTPAGPVSQQIEVARHEFAAVGKQDAVIALGEENDRRVGIARPHAAPARK